MSMLPDLRQSQVGPFAPIVAASLWLPVVHPPVITRDCNVTFLGFAVNFAQDSCISSNFGRHTSVMGDSAARARKQTYKRPVPPTGAPEQKTAHKRHNNTSPANDRVGESCSCCSDSPSMSWWRAWRSSPGSVVRGPRRATLQTMSFT